MTLVEKIGKGGRRYYVKAPGTGLIKEPRPPNKGMQSGIPRRGIGVRLKEEVEE